MNSGRLPLDLGPEPVDPAASDWELAEGERVVRVLVDEPAIDRVFDYVVPAKWASTVRVGSIVRVDLRHRRVRGWVTEIDVDPVPGMRLSPITKVSGLGPPPGVIELARWCAARWVGRVSQFLRTASPQNVVESVLRPAPSKGRPEVNDTAVTEAFGRALSVVRLPPNADVMPFAIAAAGHGRALILTPTAVDAHAVAAGLRRSGISAALMPRDWAQSAGGAVTVGTRAAALAPVGPVGAVLVIDEHDEAYQEESAPTWNARDVAIERARVDGAPCVLLSPVPSLAAVELAPVSTPARRVERDGWPVVEVIDRRGEDPATGEWCSAALSRLLTSERSIACIVNRKGRARFPICHQCGEVPRSPSGAALALVGDDLVDPVTDAHRPTVCERCGSTRFRRVRLGVSGVGEELAAMARRPVVEITGDADDFDRDAGLYVGTEALLHRLDRVDVVVFLDMDQELLAPRFRASEQAIALLAKAARLVGPRTTGGRILVQTRIPEHEVLDAVVHADPGRLVGPERERRAALELPPFRAMALVSGAVAEAYMAGVDATAVRVLGPDDGKWMVTAPDHDTLTSTLASAPRPQGRLRIEIDPLRA